MTGSVTASSTIRADVVIIGAGVIGAAIAYELSRRTTLRVLVIDKGTPGCEASGAAAGLLNVASTRAWRGVVFDLRRKSAEMFPDLVCALEAETGTSVGYCCHGALAVAFSESELLALRDLVVRRRAQALDAQLLARSEVRTLEPAINAEVIGGALFSKDCSVDSTRLVAALADAARRRGVGFKLRAMVREVVPGISDVRVRTDDGDVEAGHAVVAAGAWSTPLLASSGIKVPVRPARGEMVALRLESTELGRIVTAGDTYLTPRPNREVLVGSTQAYAGFEKRVTEEGIAELLQAAGTIIPVARQARVVRAWAGLRPCATNHRPLIGPVPGRERLIIASGHHRNGVLLAPITARIVCDFITAAPPVVAVAPFRYRPR
jgi:glycine oxidase